ncbi:MAG: SusC/RagA family TonB-linked outer membrane protein [bacterium]
MRRLLRALSLATLASGIWAAQAAAQTTVTGRVMSEAGTPIASATVAIASLNLGTSTDANGRYSLAIRAGRTAGQTVNISVRRIGFAPKTVAIALAGATVTSDFTLASAAAELEGIVVTAMGVATEKSQLGTAVQQVSAVQLERTPTTSVIDALQGKVAGLQITSAGTQGGSSKILIRGANSINGNNDPLFIVDGLPMSNADHGGGPGGARADYGSAMSDINPDDIESVSVLKGPNAAALYGSRASNGVILITTKKGTATGGRISTDFSASNSWEAPSVLPTYQNSYGQGAGGEFKFVDGQGGGVQDGNDQSYGPRLDGRTTGCTFLKGTKTYDTTPCMQFTGAGPWIPHPENVESFFRTGQTRTGYAAFRGGVDRANARLSLGAENTGGYIPNELLQKLTTSMTGSLEVNDRLSAYTQLQYVKNGGQNRPGVGYNTGITEQFIWFGRQVDMNALKNYYDSFGNLYNWNYNYHNNPYWMQSANPLKDVRDRFFGSASARYKIADGVSATLSAGSDVYRFHVESDIAKGNINYADPGYNGGLGLTDEYRNETDLDLLVTADRQLGSHFRMRANVGGNERRELLTTSSMSTSGLLVPGIFNVSNAGITPSINNGTQRRLVNGVFGSLAMTLNEWWTVEGSLRRDASSTLPPGENNYSYPGVSTSLVLSDLLPAIRRGPLSYFKLRGGYAKVGADASPYQLATTYSGQSTKFGSLPLFTLGNTIANANLKPELTTSSEGGFEMGLFNGRASIDATWYNKDTKNQIINLTVSNASGFGAVSINAGDLNNRGFEAVITTTPFRNARADWTSSFNFSHNYETVRALSPGLTNINLGSQWALNVEARAPDPKTGEIFPYGTLFGAPYARDSAGNILTSGGLPTKGANRILGTIQPRWTGGWANELRYRAFTVGGLLDFHVGGDIFSISNMFGQYSGVFNESLVGREVDWNNPGLVVKGIDTKTHQPNTINVTAEQYYQDALFQLHEAFVYKDTYTKLREVHVGVDLPQSVANKMYSNAVNVSFIARNLYTWTNVPNIDPEFAYSNGNSQGMEFAALPNARSVGFNVRITP